MCTKAVAPDVLALSKRLQVPVTRPDTGSKATSTDVLPTDLAPVITMDRPREIRYMRWGLIPHFTTDTARVTPMFNAKAETLNVLASFRGLIAAHRCLILNRGFYESQKLEQERVEWQVSPVSEEYFYKAGLWTTWQHPANGQLIESFTMITCDPAGTPFADIHNRMPVIMNKGQRRLWMNAGASQAELLSLLRPCAPELFKVTEIGRKPLKAARKNGNAPPAANLLF